MLNSETLEVAIGMAFLFLAVSLICTAVKEWLEGIFKWRAMDLERAMRTLLADADGTLTSELLRHPVLYSLFPGHYDPAQLRSSWLTPGQGSLHMRLSQRRNLPSYIPAGQFAVALLDSVARGAAPVAGADAAAAGAAPMPSPLSVAALRDSAMALASPHLQRAVLAERIRNAKQALEGVGMPIGWRTRVQSSLPAAPIELGSLPVPRQLCASHDASPCVRPQWFGGDWLGVLCGWLVTAFAVMLGASFWFDLLNKFMVIRSTVKPREKSGEAAPEDRQSSDAKKPANSGVAS